MMSRYEHRYLPPVKASMLRCFNCDHWFGGRERCGVIEPSEGPVHGCSFCRRWHGREILETEYRSVPLGLKRHPEPPDIGPLLRRSDVGFVINVDKHWPHCATCRFNVGETSCSLMRKDYCEPAGVCCDWKSRGTKALLIKRIWRSVLTFLRMA